LLERAKKARFFNIEMIDSKKIVERVERIVEPILREEGLELVDIEFRRERAGWVLRVYIDRRGGGVTLGDCVRVSRELGELLDVEDFIPYSYNLEVSSPGINRPLRKKEDFESFRGEWVKVRLVEPLRGRRNIRGRIWGVEEEKVLLIVDEELWEIPYSLIAKANLDPEIEV
jgi:ribosome maturation factor RimP